MVIQRTNVVELKPTKAQKKILRECMLLSSCVYNMANYEVRQRFFKGEKVPSFYDLKKELQKKEDYQLLGRSYASPRLKVYGETNSARFKLIKSKTQKHVGLPKYYKNRKTNTTLPSYLVIEGRQYHLGKDKLRIPLSRVMRKKYGLKSFNIGYNGVLRWKGKQQRGQVNFKDGKFYLHQSVEVQQPRKVESNVSAGIDIGIKKLIAVTTSSGEEKVIGSRRHYRQWTHYSTLIAEEKSRLAHENKCRTSKKLNNLYRVRTKWQNQLFDNIVAKTFRFLRRNNVSHLYVGDVAGIRENANHGKAGNKMLHNYWAYDLLYQKLANKAEEYGIEFQRETEEYTSQTCPVCGDRDKSHKKDRIFICSFCGNIDHRDIVGAKNIMFNGMCGLRERSTHLGEAVHLGGVTCGSS